MMARIIRQRLYAHRAYRRVCGRKPAKSFQRHAAAVGRPGACAASLPAQKVQQEGSGTGSFRTYLLDNMSTLTPQQLGGIQIETLA